MNELPNKEIGKNKLRIVALALFLFPSVLALGISTGSIQSETSSLLLRGLGVAASVCLAVLTWFTLRHNQRLLEHRRWKPLHRDVVFLITDLVDTISRNQERLTEGLNRWSIDTHCLDTVIWEERFEPRDDLDPVARVRLKRDHPELYRELVEHEQLVLEIEKQVNKARRNLREPIRNYLEEAEPLEDDQESEEWIDALNQRSEETDEIVDALLNFYHRWGREIESELWLNHQSTLGTIAEAHAEEEIDQLLTLEQRYYDTTTGLLEDLMSLRDDLQTEYGISITEFQSPPQNTPR